jgi:DNA polymerase-3 subunit alpha
LLEPAVAAAVTAVMDRLQLELKVIEKTGFISYFLIVGDFVRYGRSIGISCIARGSAAGSIVTYLLEISNVDPIRYGLLFERFLNPERINPPDIDIECFGLIATPTSSMRSSNRARSVAQMIRSGQWGEIGGSRRRARDGVELRRVRSTREDDSERAQNDVGKSSEAIPGTEGGL